MLRKRIVQEILFAQEKTRHRGVLEVFSPTSIIAVPAPPPQFHCPGAGHDVPEVLEVLDLVRSQPHLPAGAPRTQRPTGVQQVFPSFILAFCPFSKIISGALLASTQVVARRKKLVILYLIKKTKLKSIGFQNRGETAAGLDWERPPPPPPPAARERGGLAILKFVEVDGVQLSIRQGMAAGFLSGGTPPQAEGEGSEGLPLCAQEGPAHHAGGYACSPARTSHTPESEGRCDPHRGPPPPTQASF